LSKIDAVMLDTIMNIMMVMMDGSNKRFYNSTINKRSKAIEIRNPYYQLMLYNWYSIPPTTSSTDFHFIRLFLVIIPGLFATIGSSLRLSLCVVVVSFFLLISSIDRRSSE